MPRIQQRLLALLAGSVLASALVAGLWTASRRGLRSSIAADKIIDLGPWLILGAIFGARTLYVISYWRESFAGKPIGEYVKIFPQPPVFMGLLVLVLLALLMIRWPMAKAGDPNEPAPPTAIM